MRRTSSAPRHFFFDLDGTLLDAQRRLFTLFRELSPDASVSFERYWELKRSNVTQREMLKRFYGYDDAQAAQFMAGWLEHIEDERLLALDLPYPGVHELLARCAAAGLVIIVTGRQSAAKARSQLAHVGLAPCVAELLVTEHAKSKQELVLSALRPVPEDVFVGDTAEDLAAGRALGVRTIGMTHGFLNLEQILRLKPDAMATGAAELMTLLNF